jgi:hypothetical protein
LREARHDEARNVRRRVLNQPVAVGWQLEASGKFALLQLNILQTVVFSDHKHFPPKLAQASEGGSSVQRTVGDSFQFPAASFQQAHVLSGS